MTDFPSTSVDSSKEFHTQRMFTTTLSFTMTRSKEMVKILLLLFSLTVSSGQNTAPNCDPAYRAISVAEDVTPTHTVETILCTDVDTGADGTLSYAIISGNDDGNFQVTNAGVVQLIVQVDYDFGPRTYNLVVRASDGGTPSLTYDVTVDVTVTSVNEFTPELVGTPLTVSVSEDTAVGTLVAQLTPYDDDFNEDFVPQDTYISILAGGDFFFVEPVTGAVYLRKSLDFETAQTHTVSLQIQDQNILPQKQNTGTLNVNVQDVNDNSPVCSSYHFSAAIRSETDVVDTDVQDLACTDAETNNLRYSIETGNALNKFKVNHGVLKLAAQIDVDTEPNSYTLTIAVKDRGSPVRSTTVTVEVFVSGVDDNPVIWDTADDGVYDVSVAENSGLGTFIAQISATDGDLAGTPESEISYAIEDSGSIFGIETDTGRIFLAQGSLDREAQETHVISISAYPTSNPAGKILGNVTVTLSDVNDNSPVWSQNIYTVTVPEDSVVNTPVITVAASDLDKDTNGQISYSIISGNASPGCSFVINLSSGAISPATSLDYESATSCELVLQAQDGASPALAATSTVAITITGINEFTPTFVGPYTTNIPEDTAIGTTIYTVAATDSDDGIDGNLLYSLTSHTTVFSIEEDTGKIVLINSLDRETVSTYNLGVEAADSSQTAATTVTINVDDVNEFAPSCTPVFNVNSNVPITIGDTVQSLGCTDSDSGVNAQLTYSFISGNTNTDFAVVVAGDVVYNKQPTQSSYQLEIQVSDSAASPKSTTTFVVVNVETDPVFTNLPGSANIIESTSDGSLVFTVAGNAASNQKTFAIISGNTNQKFVVDTYTGQIMTLSSLDRETTDSYTLGIRITDVVFGRTADSTITITVDDANDVIPTFASNFYDLSVSEDLPLNSVIQSITASDNDAGSNADLTYSITNGNGEGKFSIDAAGQLLLAATLDAETTQSYTLTVSAVDNGSPALTGSTTVLVKVQNVDEFTPQFIVVGGTYTHSLAENTAVGALVFTVTAQDNDINTVMSYTITGGNDGSFVIDNSIGNIYLAKYLDREITPSYTLTVTADNGQGDTVSATLDITVTDTNDNDPEFTQNIYTMQVNEDQTIGAVIGQVTVSDRDEGTNGATTLSIVSGNTGNAFRVDNDNIEVNANLDFETLSKYVILVKAQDQGAVARSVTASIVIDVTPIYKQPRFVSATASVSITELTALNTVIYDADATASGATEGANPAGDLDYIILSGNSDGKFSINVLSGEILVIGSLDRDTVDTYVLTIQATNRYSTTPLRDAMTLTVTLTDVNDNAPVFTSATYNFDVNEAVALNTPVGTVVATDVDSGSNQVFSYELTSGEGLADFIMDSSTGLIRVNSVLSASTKSSYTFKITATDTGSPQQSSTADVLITVNDLNDQSPTFDSSVYNIQVNELVTVGQPIYIVKAVDGDLGANGAITYRIESGNNDHKFSLNSNDGLLIVTNVLDRETTDNYNLVVVAEDAGTPGNTGSATISIAVVDANDNQPIFTQGTYSVTLGRTDPIGTAMVQLIATDQDSGVNSEIEFYIISGDSDNNFLVDQTTGQVSTVNELINAADTYDILIHAIDKGVPKLTSSATVLVTIDPPLSPSASQFSFTVDETVSVPFDVGTISPDNVHNPGATIIFSILSGDNNGDFAIGTNTGVLKTAKQLDYESQTDYYLTINLIDQSNPALTYNKRCHVSVLDVNDNTPTFSSGVINLLLVENLPVGYTVSTITATDPDSGTNGQIIYTIDPSNVLANSMFTIGSTGALVTTTVPDFESVSRVAFSLFASDGGSPSLSGVASIVVDIVDVLDDGVSSLPTSASPFFSLECPTTASNNEVIVTMTATEFGLTVAPSDTVRFITMGKNVFSISETSGEFYVSNKDKLFPDTKYLMWIVVKVQTSANNSTGSSALVRVDTMVPKEHMVILRHSVTVAALESQRQALQVSLESLFSAGRVGIWKIQGISSSFRRRLLADESESIIYVVNDETTDSIVGVEGTKSFMSQDNILSVLRESSDGTPSSVLTTPSFATFPVTSVLAATGESSSDSGTSWPQTTVGIAVLSTIGASILLLTIILVTYFICTRGRQYSFERDENHNKKKAPMSTVLTEKNKEAVIGNGIPPSIPSYKEATEPTVLKSKSVKASHKPTKPLEKGVSKQSLNVSLMGASGMRSPDEDLINQIQQKSKSSSAKKGKSTRMLKLDALKAPTSLRNCGNDKCENKLRETSSQCRETENDLEQKQETRKEKEVNNIKQKVKHLSPKEKWERILRKAGFGLQSFKSTKDQDEIIKNYSEPGNGSKLPEIAIENKKDTIKSSSKIVPVKDTDNYCNFVRPSYKRMELEWVKCSDSKDLPYQYAKDPIYVGWTKIFARRIKQNLGKSKQLSETVTDSW